MTDDSTAWQMSPGRCLMYVEGLGYYANNCVSGRRYFTDDVRLAAPFVNEALAHWVAERFNIRGYRLEPLVTRRSLHQQPV